MVVRNLLLALVLSLSALYTYAQPKNFDLVSVFPNGAHVTLSVGTCSQEAIKNLAIELFGEEGAQNFAPGIVRMGGVLIQVCWGLSEDEDIVIIDQNGQGGAYPIQLFSMIVKQ